jgi:hypothetical protein
MATLKVTIFLLFFPIFSFLYLLQLKNY